MDQGQEPGRPGDGETSAGAVVMARHLPSPTVKGLMISPTYPATEAPKCRRCNNPMRLVIVAPSLPPEQSGTETQTFACVRCGNTVTRTVRLG
jgi:hypothetical protein